MLMKESLLFVAIILLLTNDMKIECREIRCYSCSDCANATLSLHNDFIITTRDEDQCMKTTISTGESSRGHRLISRGASSNCERYSSNHISISCCNSDFCNA